ncbi:MAG TPA: hypothetical protein VK726_21465 [Acetobacteraceae bacterium]|jgi:hypothetical protein|nr:hypothetical protein [Acetobacteraceae bacterium]
MKRITTIGLAAFGATALLAAASVAQAQDGHRDDHGHYDHRDDHPGHDWHGGGGGYVYAAPPPVYYAPPQAYYAPPPAVVVGVPGLSINIR